jgi:hypothetical protein
LLKLYRKSGHQIERGWGFSAISQKIFLLAQSEFSKAVIFINRQENTILQTLRRFQIKNKLHIRSANIRQQQQVIHFIGFIRYFLIADPKAAKVMRPFK